MTNSDIADQLKLYADLSELHGRNPFKIKSYAAASFKIDKLPVQLEGKTLEELEHVDGIGKSLASKIVEINSTGSFEELNDLLNDTPKGVLDMFRVKGIGPKKIAYIWKELGIESIGELLYACNENRLAQVKGFGLKTQQSVKQNIEFIFASAHRFHYATIEPKANELQKELLQLGHFLRVSPAGGLRRRNEIIDEIELIAGTDDSEKAIDQLLSKNLLAHPLTDNNIVSGRLADYPVKITLVADEEFPYQLFLHTAHESHLAETGHSLALKHAPSEEHIYQSLGMQYVEPELREGLGEIAKARNNALPNLIELGDLKGILHNHSNYSDGLNTLEEMALYCRELGYEYLGMCDHSKSAFYANGLDEARIVKQHAEIDALNKKLAPFRIFKGIESDILYDGSLDYSNEVLASFDFIVASVHANLKMNEEKAMSRLIRAIENPYTTILGHPTGRLLLMREGYPVDHKRMIDACAANGVVIEINANPYRLDLDWRWIDYALNKNVMLSINPDAHERSGFHDMYYGIAVARKGGLTKEMCFNTKSLAEIDTYFRQRRSLAQ